MSTVILLYGEFLACYFLLAVVWYKPVIFLSSFAMELWRHEVFDKFEYGEKLESVIVVAAFH